MRKLITNKPFATIAAVSAICLVIMFAVNSCRKIDYRPKTNDVVLEQKFFNSRVSSVPVVNAVTGFAHRQNQKYGFVENLVKRIGFPYWDKALTFSGPLEYARGSGGSDSADIVYVPFVRESENFVNAALIVKMTDTDTAFRILCDWQYKDFGFDAVSRDQWNARNVFHIFALLDRSVFNRKDFQIIDERLLTRDDIMGMDSLNQPFDSLKLIYTLENSQLSGRSALMVPVEVCNTVVSCFLWGNGMQCAGRNSSHGPIVCCLIQLVQQICTTVWVDYGQDGGGGGSGGGSQGGSGAPGGGWEPPPCGGGAGRYLVVNPCGPGWIPVVLEDPPPITLPNDSIIALNLKNLYLKAENLPDSLLNSAMQDGDERTFTFNLMPPNDTVAAYPKRGNKLSSQPTLFPNSFAIWHCHQDDGPNDPYKNQSFDGPDIYKLYKNRTIDGYPIEVSLITTRDYIYAAVVVDAIKFSDYIKSITGNPKDIKVLARNLNDLHIDEWDNCTSCSWQKGSEAGTLAITANNNSNISGIKIFRSPRQNINFTLLTP